MGLEFKVGDKVVALEAVGNNLGERFSAGTEFIVCRADVVAEDMAMVPATNPEDVEYGGIWFYPEDCSTKFQLATAKVEGQTTPTPRVNYLYVVEDDDGAYVKTFDRGYAREVKAELGGKKAGVIITAYAAVKEIR